MEVLTIGLSTTIIGMVTVFAVLCIIALMLNLMQYISGDKKPPGDGSKKEEPPAATIVPAEAKTADKLNADIVAVITAAIAATMNTSGDRLIVRSLRKVSPWINAARSEQV